MANALNRKLTIGDVVVVKKNVLMSPYCDQDRRVVIRTELFGAETFTAGNKIGISWFADKVNEVFSAMDFDKEESEAAQEAMKTDPEYGWIFEIIRSLQKIRTNLESELYKFRTAQRRSRIVSITGVEDSLDEEPDEWLIYITRSNGKTSCYRIPFDGDAVGRLTDVMIKNMQCPYSQFDRFFFCRNNNDVK